MAIKALCWGVAQFGMGVGDFGNGFLAWGVLGGRPAQEEHGGGGGGGGAILCEGVGAGGGWGVWRVVMGVWCWVRCEGGGLETQEQNQEQGARLNHWVCGG